MIEIKSCVEGHKLPLKCIVSVRLPKLGNLVINNIAYFVQDNKKWVSMPSMTCEKSGKKEKMDYVEFESKKVNDALKKAIKDKIEEHLLCPMELIHAPINNEDKLPI